MRILFTILLTLTLSQNAYAENEVSLFNSSGKAVAYIDFDDELTIYLWNGTPVAYLSVDDDDGFNVYGFNGKHLGWFVNGVIRGHDGYASCAIKSKLASTSFEPFKAFKKFKPFKSFEKFAPFKPFFRNSFSENSCEFVLIQGSK